MKNAIFALTLLCSSLVSAGEPEYPASFKIEGIKVSGADNFHFRVIGGDNWHCHNGPSEPKWSYINESDSGAAGKMSTLLAAYMAGKTVSLTTEGKDIGGLHVCNIIEFTIKD